MNDFTFMTLRAAVWTLEQLHYQQLRSAPPQGLLLFQPAHSHNPQKKKKEEEENDAQSPRSDVKGIISLSDVSGARSPAISPKREGNYRLVRRAPAFGFMTGRQIHRTIKPAKTDGIETNGRKEKKDWFVWNDCAAGINAGEVWIMLNSSR